jgi:hypothetical protein
MQAASALPLELGRHMLRVHIATRVPSFQSSTNEQQYLVGLWDSSNLWKVPRERVHSVKLKPVLIFYPQINLEVKGRCSSFASMASSFL